MTNKKASKSARAAVRSAQRDAKSTSTVMDIDATSVKLCCGKMCLPSNFEFISNSARRAHEIFHGDQDEMLVNNVLATDSSRYVSSIKTFSDTHTFHDC